jgi:uncharacterized protein with HEPN domain
MRGDVLLLEQMIEAADQAVALVEDVAVQELAGDRIRRDALLWNFTILGEDSAQLSDDVKEQFADVAWRQPARLRNRIVHGYWSIDLDIVHTTAREQRPWVRRRPQACACRHYLGGRLIGARYGRHRVGRLPYRVGRASPPKTTRPASFSVDFAIGPH